jgi:hypothetical protein
MMSNSKLTLAALLGVTVLAATGCRHNIVQAEPPSVASPPIIEPLPAPEQPPAREAESTPAPVPEPGTTPPPPANVSAEPAPARPRPAPAETEVPKPKPDAPAPVIAPQLSARQQADATRATNDDIRVAEKNLRGVSGKPLKPPQQDLVDKIEGFLSQAHEAIRADDWVRAQNLAHKAEVLSVELNRSF